MLNGRSSSSYPGNREEQEHLNQLLFGLAVFPDSVYKSGRTGLCAR